MFSTDDYLPISFRTALLAMAQFYDCPSDCVVTLRDVGKTNLSQTTTKHYEARIDFMRAS